MNENSSIHAKQLFFNDNSVYFHDSVGEECGGGVEESHGGVRTARLESEPCATGSIGQVMRSGGIEGGNFLLTLL